MNKAYLLTGGNEGDRLANLQWARTKIEYYCGPVLARSSVYETAAWGNRLQSDYLNQVLLIATPIEPRPLLEFLLTIEAEAGRVRSTKNAPRSLDIDILFFNDRIIDEPGLTIPHPRIADRRFVLEPLAEIAPEYRHPRLNKSVEELLLTCTDPLFVKKIL